MKRRNSNPPPVTLARLFVWRAKGPGPGFPARRATQTRGNDKGRLLLPILFLLALAAPLRAGTVLDINQGGTGQTTASTAFNALSPMTTAGDLIYGGSSGSALRLSIGSSGQCLVVSGGDPAWGSCSSGSGTVTSVGLSDASTTPIYAVSGSPVTSSGTLTLTLDTETRNTVFAGPSSGSAAQPGFRAIVGADLPNPAASTLGGIESLASTSHEWINQISTSGVPSATQPAFTDISGSVAASQLPNPGASSLGGIESYAAVSNQWINAISTSGVPSSTQPAFSNLSGTATTAQLPTFTNAMTASAIASNFGGI